jgi:hypothetical protein
MVDMNPKEAFFRFVRGHDLFSDLEFLDEPVEGQEIIAVLDDSFSFTAEDGVVINPEYDEIINGFMDITYDRWAVNHIYNLVENAKKSYKQTQLLAEAITDLIIKPLINSNVNSNKVYFVIRNRETFTDLSWADKVIEV